MQATKNNEDDANNETTVNDEDENKKSETGMLLSKNVGSIICFTIHFRHVFFK